MLPAPLHRGQQQFPGQLVLGHLWNQGNQGAGSALPGLQVLVGRGDAGRNDVRVGGHELQRLHAQNPPNQVGRNGDWRRLKTQTCPSALMNFVPLLSSKQISASADAEQGLHSQDRRKCVWQSQHVSTLAHPLTLNKRFQSSLSVYLWFPPVVSLCCRLQDSLEFIGQDSNTLWPDQNTGVNSLLKNIGNTEVPSCLHQVYQGIRCCSVCVVVSVVHFFPVNPSGSKYFAIIQWYVVHFVSFPLRKERKRC